MKHVSLTCKNHPQLRWSCKSIAFSPGRGYNGARHIFYLGTKLSEEQKREMGVTSDVTLLEAECTCIPSELILSPEDEWAKFTDQKVRERQGPREVT